MWQPEMDHATGKTGTTLPDLILKYEAGCDIIQELYSIVILARHGTAFSALCGTVMYLLYGLYLSAVSSIVSAFYNYVIWHFVMVGHIVTVLLSISLHPNRNGRGPLHSCPDASTDLDQAIVPTIQDSNE